MLVLARKVGERITIGEEGQERITITLVKSRDGRASLGIDAPPYVEVHREEVARLRQLIADAGLVGEHA